LFVGRLGRRAPLPELRDWFRWGFEQANFLHRVHLSILEPEYVGNDISFINWAFPVHIEWLGAKLGAKTAALMLEFYDGVPEALRPQLEWHPTAEFRQLAAQGSVPPDPA
jgi:hypothetical protein